jgi:transcription elongation factor Elf1
MVREPFRLPPIWIGKRCNCATKSSRPMQPIVSTDITCPHCGETFSLEVDTSQSEQDLIEDCSVCCRPINFKIRCRPGEVVALASSP